MLANASLLSYCQNHYSAFGSLNWWLCYHWDLEKRNTTIDALSTLKYSGHVVYMDRLYTSVKLIQGAKALSQYVCGTVSSNRGFPALLSAPNPYVSAPGEWDFLFRHGIYAYAWMDSTHCQLLSSFHAPKPGKVDRRARDTPGRPARTAPQAFVDYNLGMGGNDAGDMIRTRMTSHQKSKKWWKGVFYYVFDQALISTLRVWNDLRKASKLKKWTMEALLSQLFLTLCAPDSQRYVYSIRKDLSSSEPIPRERPSAISGQPAPKRICRASIRRNPIDFDAESFITHAQDHTLALASSRYARCKRCSTLHKEERRTNKYCRECDCPFCEKCFYEYHHLSK